MWFKERPITRQLGDFVEWKKESKGTPIAIEHKENLLTFIAVSKIESFETIVIDHIWVFKDWLLNKYGSSYIIEKNMHSLRCFLKFCRRYDILRGMTTLGRKPNLKMIEIVKGYRKKKISYRDLQLLLQNKLGRKYALKTLYFWANH